MDQIDSAVVYRNEEPCAEAIRKSGIPREDIFFTSKVPPRAMSYESTKTFVNTSLRKTGLDYIDLYGYSMYAWLRSGIRLRFPL